MFASQLGILKLGEATLGNTEALQLEDNFTLSDSIEFGFPIGGVTVTDSLSLTDFGDSVYSSALGEISLGAFLLGDSAKGTAYFSLSVTSNSVSTADTLSLSDTQSLGIGLRVSDSLSLSDATSYAFLVAVFPLSVTVEDQILRSPGRSLAMRDGVSHLLSPASELYIGVSDINSFANDALFSGLGILFSDTLSLSDTASAATGFRPEVYDELNSFLFDAIQIGFGSGLSLSDSLAFFDSVSTFFSTGAPSLSDSLSFADQVLLSLFNITSFSDILTLTDSVSARISPILLFGDSMNNWQDIVFNGPLTTSLIDLFDDQFDMMDSVMVHLSTSRTAYLRHYLNDVV